jgi:hypothetical protein
MQELPETQIGGKSIESLKLLNKLLGLLMNSSLLIAIIVSEFISLILLVKIIKSEELMPLKILGGLVVFIPIIGPIMYFFVFGMPTAKPLHQQHRRSSIGNYNQETDSETKLFKKFYKEDSKNKKT